MRTVKSCGVLCLKNPDQPAFLLMRHSHRYDLPKGHLEAGETEEECAIRELREETGISPTQLQWIDGFRHETSYRTCYRRFGNQPVQKTLVIFAAWVPDDVDVIPSEHQAAEWMPWDPPHAIQELTIDPLLADLARELEN